MLNSFVTKETKRFLHRRIIYGLTGVERLLFDQVVKYFFFFIMLSKSFGAMSLTIITMVAVMALLTDNKIICAPPYTRDYLLAFKPF